VLDAHPVLKIGGADHVEHDDGATGMLSPAAGIAKRAGALGRIVYDHQKLAAVACFGTASFRRHDFPCCHHAPLNCKRHDAVRNRETRIRAPETQAPMKPNTFLAPVMTGSATARARADPSARMVST